MGSVGEFSLRVDENGHGPVVQIVGEIDIATAPQLRECIEGLDSRSVTLDFSAVTFLDSSGISVLIGARKRAEREGGALVLREVRPAQKKVIELCGLEHFLSIDGNGADGAAHSGEAHHKKVGVHATRPGSP